MSKYIDAEKMIAEIERRLKIVEPHKDTFESAAACRQELIWMKNFITSLHQEQPEVELEKEMNQWRHKHFKGERDGDYSGEYLVRESQLDIARHFYELGRTAK